MKTELEQQDIEAIAKELIELLKPVLASYGRNEGEYIIFDVAGLAKYLEVSETWIYERTHFKEIPHLKIKGHLRFRKKDIDKWLNSFSVPMVNTPEQVLKAVRR